MSLAANLPYDHPYAGGFSGIGSQPLPTDADALDYLSRVAAADGAAVEVGVAMAVDRFVKGCKADSAGYAGDPTRTVWDSIKSACIMCGARTLPGALVSLKAYGDELVDINNLPTPTIANLAGSAGYWSSGLNTFGNETAGTDSGFPRFGFSISGMAVGKQYRVSGRLSGDITRVTNIRLATSGAANSVTYNSSTGIFDGIAASAVASLEFVSDGRYITSIRIESLSIKEYFANPTNVANNFSSGDYSRGGATPGLKGDGSTKYLDTNRANNADGQNDNHNAVYCSQAATALSGYLGSGAAAAGGNQIAPDPGLTIMNMRNRRSTGAGSTPSGYHAATGFMGHSRSESSGYDIRISSTNLSAALTSETPVSDNLTVFKLGSFGLVSNARIAFYSIGSSLSLSALDSRVSTLVSEIAAAI